MAKFFLFGDSILFGAWDFAGGWAERFRQDIARHNIDTDFEPYYEAYNLGIPGDTTHGIIERFERELTPRIDSDQNSILFAVGINDANYIINNHEYVVPFTTFQENIHNLISLALPYAHNIIFIGLTPVDESKTNPIPWRIDLATRNKNIQMYDDILQTIVSDHSLHYIHLYKKLIEKDFNNFLIDGIHPDTKGHEYIYQEIKEYLISHNLISL